MNALVDFGNGKRLSMQVSSDMSLSQSVHITGRRGWGRLDTPFNPCEIATASWAVGEIGESTKIFEPYNQYVLMLESFRNSCENNVVPSFKKSKQICELLEQIIKLRN